MTGVEALKLLDSKTLHDRLRAARYLAVNARPEDEARIRQQLAKEEVSWVRGALQAALDRLSLSLTAEGPHEPEREGGAERQFADIHAQAIEETTATLVHELEPILGLLRLNAAREIADYPQSQTKRQLDRFESLLTAIDTLSRAASVPKIEEFDLAALLRRVVGAEQREPVEIEVAGPEPMLVWGDVSLIELAVTNGIRNAVEASSGFEVPKKRVVVNWGETDREYWIVVLDRGAGLPVNAVRIFDIGATTKQGHLGMGLALARTAVISLGGNLTVAPREDGGVRFECRWLRDVRAIR